jgi:hypothetical protein
MLRVTSREWPIQQTTVSRSQHYPVGIAPLRHELALAHYVESRLQYEELARRRPAISDALVDTYRASEHWVVAVLRGASVIPPAWFNYRP